MNIKLLHSVLLAIATITISSAPCHSTTGVEKGISCNNCTILAVVANETDPDFRPFHVVKTGTGQIFSIQPPENTITEMPHSAICDNCIVFEITSDENSEDFKPFRTTLTSAGRKTEYIRLTPDMPEYWLHKVDPAVRSLAPMKALRLATEMASDYLNPPSQEVLLMRRLERKIDNVRTNQIINEANRRIMAPWQKQ